jgi:ribosomal protein S18 acetylase RimI-like enzyme
MARRRGIEIMDRPFEIRRARPDDVQQVHEVHSVAIRTGAKSSYEPEAVEVWIDAFNRQNFPANIERMEFYVAELQSGRIGAFLAFDLNTAEIDSVYVAPWGGGLGLGSFLLGFAEEKGRLAGLDTMWLDASLNAVSFYRRYGWNEVERHARIRKGIEIPVVKMEKILTS